MVHAGVDESVSTFGLWDIKPNFYNAVPRSVRVDIDIRDSDKERRDGIISATLDGAEQIAARRKCGYSGEVKFEYPIAKSDKKVSGLSLPSLQRLSMCSLCQLLLCQPSELPASGSQGKIALLLEIPVESAHLPSRRPVYMRCARQHVNMTPSGCCIADP